MPYNNIGKKVLIGAIALSLVAGSGLTVPVNVHAAAMTTPFKDISKGHWAEKHIAKLALQGIITGYTSGSSYVFQPSQNVSQQEAVLMALRFAGLDKQADQEAIIGFPESFSVSAYFKPYVLLAFSTGLLDQEQEYALAANNSASAWGTKPASREWVTKLMIRAIGKDADAVSMQDTPSSFSDASQIDSFYKGYVNAASSLGLVKGVTDVKFDPKANVNRASLATMFSRAQNLYEVAYEGQKTGIVSQLSDSSISVYSNGQSESYTLDADTLYYHYQTETPVTKDKLLLYGDVTVIGKNGKAQYVEVKGDKQHTKTVSGTLDRVIADEKKIYIWVNNKPVEIQYDDSLVVADSSGNTIELADIKRDTPISIIQDDFREQPVTLKIVAAVQSSATMAKGTFYGAVGDLITIMEGTELVSKFMTEDVVVEIEGMASATSGDLLKEADQVELTLNNEDKVTKIKVTNRNIKGIAGAQVVSFVYDKRLLTLVDANGENAQVLYFTDKTKIEHNGTVISLASAASSLTLNRKVVVTYTGNTIVSLEFLTNYKGTLTSINGSSSTLTIKLDSGATVTLPYSSAAVDVANVSSASLNDLNIGDMVTVELNSTQDRISSIKAHTLVQYEVISVDKVNKRLRVRNAAKEVYDLNVLSIPLTNEAGDRLTVDKIAVGSIINTSYIGRLATAVKVVNITTGQVTAVTEHSVTVKDLSGNTVVYNDDVGFIIYKGASQGTSSNLLAVGDYVEVLKTDKNKFQFTAAVGENRVFVNYNVNDSQIWTEFVSSSDNRNYFNVNSSTKLTHKGSAITLQDLKAGDKLVIYSFRNNALEIVKQ